MHKPRNFTSQVMAAIAYIMQAPAMGTDEKRRRYRKLTNRYTALYAKNGQREVSRRLRQIEAGSLRVQNGLEAPFNLDDWLPSPLQT